VNTGWKNKGGVFPVSASRICDNGEKEIGELYCAEKTVRWGVLKATYEYNIYHWLESDEWEADVVSPHGWHDVAADELRCILRELKLVET
jgi:hypothetical protein